MADYNFGNVILGAISDTMSRNEQQRQFNVNDQWRNFALQKELEEAERQRVFTGRQNEEQRRLAREMQQAGFVHQTGERRESEAYDWRTRTTGFGLDPVRGDVRFGQYTDPNFTSKYIPPHLLDAVLQSGKYLPSPQFTGPRPDLTERVFTPRTPENLLAMTLGNAFAPGVGGAIPAFGGPTAAEFFGSTTAGQRRVTARRKQQFEQQLKRDPAFLFKYYNARRLGLDPLGDYNVPGMLNYSFGFER